MKTVLVDQTNISNQSLTQTEANRRKKFKSLNKLSSPIMINQDFRNHDKNDSSTPFPSAINLSPLTRNMYNSDRKCVKRKLEDNESNYFYLKSDIDSLLTCQICKQYYNLNEKQPKIICEKLTACYNCVKNKAKIECPLCGKIHLQSDKGFQTNTAILFLIGIKPTKISNEEILIESKIDRAKQNFIQLSNKIKHKNAILKSKFDEYCATSDNLKKKISLKQSLEKLEKIIELYEDINEKFIELEMVFESNYEDYNEELMNDESINNMDIIDVVKQEIGEMSFNFAKISDKDLFYPISKFCFLVAESEVGPDPCIKLNILNEQMKIINEKLIKKSLADSFKIIFGQKFLNIILISNSKQIISTYEYGKLFHNLKCIGSNKKIVYVSAEEIFIYSDSKLVITVLDFEFNKKDMFGQIENENDKFYLPKSGFEILYANNTFIFLKDTKKKLLRKIDRSSGENKQCFFHDPNLFLDKILIDLLNRVILVHKSSDKIVILDDCLNEIKQIELNFDYKFDNFYLTTDNEIAFVYFSKNFIKFLKL